MKSWKNLWKAELDNATPKLRQDVKDQPINVATIPNGKPARVAVYKRKPFMYGVASAVAAVLIAIVLCATLIPVSGNVDTFAFVVEVNPAVTISTDCNGKVTGIVSSNADADVILSDAATVNGLKGNPIDEVIKWYVDQTAQLGYLDTENVKAVRITTVNDGDKLLSKVTDTVEKYFIDNGLKSVVIADIVDLTAFAERSKIDVTNSIKAVTDCVQSFEPIFRNRNADGLSKDELQQIYKDCLSADVFVKSLGDYLNGIIDKIEQNERDVRNLYELNSQIMFHPDNCAIVKDYWNVKTFLKYFDFGEEFAALVKEMDDKVALYNNTYGSDMTDVVDLYYAVKMYDIISAQDLRGILQFFNSDFLTSHIEWLTDIIRSVSIDTSFAEITSLPNTVEEFVDKVRDIVELERTSRAKQFEEIYNSVRDKMSRSDYDKFKSGLFGQYASTDEMWNNLK